MTTTPASLCIALKGQQAGGRASQRLMQTPTSLLTLEVTSPAG